MPLAMTLHLLAAVVWVGGMFFAYTALRPVAGRLLEPSVRLTLWAQVFSRFFPWVWLTIAILLITGFWMIFSVFGGMAKVGPHVHLMMTLGIIMMLIFAHVYYSPFRKLKRSVENSDWPEGAKKLHQIRVLIAANLTLGLLVIVIAVAGRYM